MRLIYAQGFSKLEREEWRAVIFNNTLTALKQILEAMEEYRIGLQNKKNEVHPSSRPLMLCLTRFHPKGVHRINLARSRYRTQGTSTITVSTGFQKPMGRRRC